MAYGWASFLRWGGTAGGFRSAGSARDGIDLRWLSAAHLNVLVRGDLFTAPAQDTGPARSADAEAGARANIASARPAHGLTGAA
jgi:hypothetical protein